MNNKRNSVAACQGDSLLEIASSILRALDRAYSRNDTSAAEFVMEGSGEGELHRGSGITHAHVEALRAAVKQQATSAEVGA